MLTNLHCRSRVRLLAAAVAGALLVGPGVLRGQPPATPPAPAPGGAAVAPITPGQLPFAPQAAPKDINERLERLRTAARRGFTAAIDRASRGVDGVERPVPPPALTIENRFRDAGAVADTDRLSLTWRLRNPGTAAVRILQVRPLCTCVSVEGAEQTIAPGGEGEIRATFNPDGRMGVEFRELEVQTDALAGGRFRVGFLVETRARVMIDPVSVNLGEARAASEHAGTERKEGSITIVGRDPAFDVVAVSFDPPAPEFSVTRGVREKFRGEDGSDLVRVRYDLGFVPGLPLGKREATLQIRTNDAVRQVLPAVVSAESVGDLKFRPGRVRLQGIGAGNAWQRLMKVEHRDGKPFRILGVDVVGTPAAWGVVADLEEDLPDPESGTVNGYMVRVFGVAPTTDIPIAGVLRIRTSVPNQEVVEFPFTGGSPRGAAPAEGGGGSEGEPGTGAPNSTPASGGSE